MGSHCRRNLKFLLFSFFFAFLFCKQNTSRKCTEMRAAPATRLFVVFRTRAEYQCFWRSRFPRLCVNFFFTLCSLHRATDSCFLSSHFVEHYAGAFFSTVSIYSAAFRLTKLSINYGSSRLMNRWLPMVF